MERAKPSKATQLGMGLFVLWVAARHGVLGSALPRVRLAWLQFEGIGPFLHVDLSWLLFALALATLARFAPSELATRCGLALLAAAQAACHAAVGLDRYYAGNALAWDLANFVQPMWRAAHGASMAATWSSDAPLWGDHGSFAFFGFAPLVRVGGDPATALIIFQALLTASFGPALYGLTRRMGIERLPALASACALSSSRALANAAGFDFHPESALPSILTLLCWSHMAGRPRLVLLCALAGASLKDGAAMVVAMTTAFLGARPLHLPTLRIAAVAAAIACFDVLWLPQLTGWPSYVQMNASAPADLWLGLQTTVGRTLTQGGLGWLHPVAWLAGGPWVLAAAMSPKLAVKGILFQYGFLWVPVGALGTSFMLRWLSDAHRQRVALVWSVFTLALNAPLGAPTSLSAHAQSFQELRRELSEALPGQGIVATDACTAPLLMDRMVLRGLCQLDVAALTADGTERWSEASQRALGADVVVIDRNCQAHGACLSEQLAALQQRGFELARFVKQRWGVFQRRVSP